MMTVLLQDTLYRVVLHLDGGDWQRLTLLGCANFKRLVTADNGAKLMQARVCDSDRPADPLSFSVCARRGRLIAPSF